MIERFKEIKRVHLILGIAIIMAIPCYCFGLFMLWNSDNLTESEKMTATQNVTEPGEITLAPTFTYLFMTQTSTLTPTITPTFTATITYVLPVTDTPTPTITYTSTSTLQPTETLIPSPTNTATNTLTPSSTAPDPLVPAENP
ncbi:MAG: hypothetical protein Q7J07_09720 [Pelolinea sp.]|nr:hypothetical protein [Pelolinea sp.]